MSIGFNPDTFPLVTHDCLNSLLSGSNYLLYFKIKSQVLRSVEKYLFSSKGHKLHEIAHVPFFLAWLFWLANLTGHKKRESERTKQRNWIFPLTRCRTLTVMKTSLYSLEAVSSVIVIWKLKVCLFSYWYLMESGVGPLSLLVSCPPSLSQKKNTDKFYSNTGSTCIFPM